MRMRIFHIVDCEAWADAAAVGRYEPASLAAEGFVHFSFVEQVNATIERHYAGVAGLCVVEFESDALGADVVVEDSYGSGTAYPHVYAPIRTSAAIAVHTVPFTGGR
jgi:uncharacterized protein (DUF952 family)